MIWGLPQQILLQFKVVKIANCTPTHSWGQPTSFQGFTSSGSLYFIIPGQKRERKKAVWSFLLKSCEIQKLWTACVITFVREVTDKQTFGAMVLVKHFPLYSTQSLFTISLIHPVIQVPFSMPKCFKPNIHTLTLWWVYRGKSGFNIFSKNTSTCRLEGPNHQPDLLNHSWFRMMLVVSMLSLYSILN